LLSADGLAQALFDNCFEVPDGPDAPDLDFIELDRELVMILTNDTVTSNNAFELYEEKGLEIPPLEVDSLYRFEGYKVFQLAGPEVGPGDLDDIEKARLIVQVDVKNGVNKIYNWSPIPDPNPNNNEILWIPEEKVSGADQGIRHTFQILEDQFGAQDRRLVNHKKYYYMALAYGYNNYATFEPATVLGQRAPYLEGRRNIKTYVQIPRPIVYKDLNAFYGEGPTVIGLGGIGAGGNFLDITDETREEILASGYAPELEYKPGGAPIEVKVYDPLRIQNGSFILEFNDNDGNDAVLAPNARWRLWPENDPGAVIRSERNISSFNEQIIGNYGFTVSLGQTDDVGQRADATNGAIGATLEYLDPDGPQWFAAVPDGPNLFNYIKTAEMERDFLLDPTQALSTIGAGLFTPFHLGEYDQQQAGQLGFFVSPTWLENGEAQVRNQQKARLRNLNNVDIVLTSDKSKWSRCIVVDTYNDFFAALGDPINIEGSSDNMEI
ncbi:MAG: hypothetical protein R3330_12875, partial [Saprospiraceae bacterium]|nr:hypothetical protein [Saprospiraceae bacterium]